MPSKQHRESRGCRLEFIRRVRLFFPHRMGVGPCGDGSLRLCLVGGVTDSDLGGFFFPLSAEVHADHWPLRHVNVGDIAILPPRERSDRRHS